MFKFIRPMLQPITINAKSSGRCRRCKGTGRVTSYWKRNSQYVNEIVTCPICQGKGKI